MKTKPIEQDVPTTAQEHIEIFCDKKDVNSYIKYGLHTKDKTTQLSFCEYIKQEKKLENNVLIWLKDATIEPYKEQKSRDCKGLNFEGVLFENVTFENCDLTGAKFNDTFGEITFTNSKIAGVDFTGSEVDTCFGLEYRQLGTEYFKDAKFHFTEEQIKKIDEAKKNSIISQDSQLANIVINPNWKDNVILPPKPNQLKTGRVDVEVYLTEDDFKDRTPQKETLLDSKIDELKNILPNKLEEELGFLSAQITTRKKELIQQYLEANSKEGDAQNLYDQYNHKVEQYILNYSNPNLNELSGKDQALGLDNFMYIKDVYNALTFDVPLSLASGIKRTADYVPSFLKPLKNVAGYTSDALKIGTNLAKNSLGYVPKERDLKAAVEFKKEIEEFEDKYGFGDDDTLNKLRKNKYKIDSNLLTLYRNENVITNYEHYKNNKQLSFKGVCEDLVFEGVDFSKINLNGIDFHRCKFNNCKFDNKINKSNFRECWITKATGSLRFEQSDVSFLKTLDSDLNLRIKGGKTDYLEIENQGTTKISDANCEGMKYQGADKAALLLTSVDWSNGKLDGKVSTLKLDNVRVNQNTDFTSMSVNDSNQNVTWNGEISNEKVLVKTAIGEIKNNQRHAIDYWLWNKPLSYADPIANSTIFKNSLNGLLYLGLGEYFKPMVEKMVKDMIQYQFENNQNIRSAVGGIALGLVFASAAVVTSLAVAATAPLSLPIIAGAAIIGAGIGAIAARSDSVVENKYVRAIIGPMVAIGVNIFAFFTRTSISRKTNRLINNLYSPNEVSLSEEFSKDFAKQIVDNVQYNKLNVAALDKFFEKVPATSVLKYVESLRKTFLTKDKSESTLENITKQIEKLERFIEDKQEVRVSDILPYIANFLPPVMGAYKNDGTLEKEYEKAKPYFVAQDKEQIVKNGKINALKNLYVDGSTQQKNKDNYLDNAKHAAKGIKVVSDNEKAINKSELLKKAIQTIGITQI